MRLLQPFDEDDGIDWKNSDYGEGFEDDTVLNDIDVDHLTLAQISGPVCEESMKISILELDFTKSVGPNVHLDSFSTAMDALIFEEDTFQLPADQTDLYARQSPPGTSYKWYDTKMKSVSSNE